MRKGTKTKAYCKLTNTSAPFHPPTEEQLAWHSGTYWKRMAHMHLPTTGLTLMQHRVGHEPSTTDPPTRTYGSITSRALPTNYTSRCPRSTAP